jgi:integral membrane sensor domain MASE1
MATFVVFVVGVVLTPVGQSFLRYAAEFITRVTLATFPAIVILAGLGSAWALRRGWPWRLPAAALLGAAFYTGVRLWIGWIR